MSPNAAHKPDSRPACVTEDEVRAMRRAAHADGYVDRDEAAALLRLDRHVQVPSRAWADWLAEAVADAALGETLHGATLAADAADWLLDATDAAPVPLPTLHALVRVLERCGHVPDRFYETTLRRIAERAWTGVAPDAQPAMDEDGVALLRRALFASGGDGAIAISRNEAVFLFDLNDALDPDATDPSWRTLFAQCVANHLMAATGHLLCTRRHALERAKLVREARKATFLETLAATLRRLATGNLEALNERYAARNEAAERAISEAERITPDEAAWVVERIGADGRLCPSEEALVAILRESLPELCDLVRQRLAA